MQTPQGVLTSILATAAALVLVASLVAVAFLLLRSGAAMALLPASPKSPVPLERFKRRSRRTRDALEAATRLLQ